MTGPHGAGAEAALLRLALGRAVEEFRADERNRKSVSLAATVALPALLAVGCAFLPALWAWDPWVTLVGVVLLLAAQGAAVWLTLDRPATTGPLLVALAESEGALRSERAAVSELRDQTERLLLLDEFARGVAVAGARVRMQPTDLMALIEALCGPLAADPQRFFGISEGVHWSLGVYLHDTASGRLRCLWLRRDARHPGRGRAPRTWRPGEGHVGQTFALHPARLKEGKIGLITPDATAADQRAFFEGSGDQARDYDGSAYRSFASFGFGRPDAQAEPLGVVIATAARVGAFTELTARPLLHCATTLSALYDLVEAERGRLDWTAVAAALGEQ